MTRTGALFFGLLLVMTAALTFARMNERPRFPQLGFDSTPDFRAIDDIPTRKEAFFGFLGTHLEVVNAEIARDRVAVEELRAGVQAGREIAGSDRRRLDAIVARYKLPAFSPDSNEDWETLLRRVDVIPASLVLAQAANESAWGTSRFAVEANNFFGQWCYERGCGVVPSKRSAGATHEVRRFKSAQDSVAAYAANLNTNPAFSSLRSLRSRARRSDQDATGTLLAGGLVKYSERGQAYVDELRALIRHNHLETRTDVAASGSEAR